MREQENEINKAMEIRQKSFEETVRLLYSLISCLKTFIFKIHQTIIRGNTSIRREGFLVELAPPLFDRRQTE